MTTRDSFVVGLEEALPSEPLPEEEALDAGSPPEVVRLLTKGEQLMSSATIRFITDGALIDRTANRDRFLELRSRSDKSTVITLHREGMSRDEYKPETEAKLLADVVPTIIRDRRKDNDQEIDAYSLDAGTLIRRTIHRDWNPKRAEITPDIIQKVKEVQSSPATAREIAELGDAIATFAAFARSPGTLRLDNRPNSQPALERSFSKKMLGKLGLR